MASRAAPLFIFQPWAVPLDLKDLLLSCVAERDLLDPTIRGIFDYAGDWHASLDLLAYIGWRVFKSHFSLYLFLYPGLVSPVVPSLARPVRNSSSLDNHFVLCFLCLES